MSNIDIIISSQDTSVVYLDIPVYYAYYAMKRMTFVRGIGERKYLFGILRLSAITPWLMCMVRYDHRQWANWALLVQTALLRRNAKLCNDATCEAARGGFQGHELDRGTKLRYGIFDVPYHYVLRTSVLYNHSQTFHLWSSDNAQVDSSTFPIAGIICDQGWAGDAMIPDWNSISHLPPLAYYLAFPDTLYTRLLNWRAAVRMRSSGLFSVESAPHPSQYLRSF